MAGLDVQIENVSLATAKERLTRQSMRGDLLP